MGASVAAASAHVSYSFPNPSKLLHHLSPKAMLRSLTRSGSSTLYLSFHPVPLLHLPHAGGQAIVQSCHLSAVDDAHGQLPLPPGKGPLATMSHMQEQEVDYCLTSSVTCREENESSIPGAACASEGGARLISLFSSLSVLGS